MTPSTIPTGEGLLFVPPHLWETFNRIPRMADGSYTIIDLTFFEVDDTVTVNYIVRANGKQFPVRKKHSLQSVLKKLGFI